MVIKFENMFYLLREFFKITISIKYPGSATSRKISFFSLGQKLFESLNQKSGFPVSDTERIFLMFCAGGAFDFSANLINREAE